MLGTHVCFGEGILESWPQLSRDTPTSPMTWAGAFLKEVSSRPSIRDKVTWELEGRGRPAWISLGSELTGLPGQSNLWSHFGTGLQHREPTDSTLDNCCKGQYWALVSAA